MPGSQIGIGIQAELSAQCSFEDNKVGIQNIKYFPSRFTSGSPCSCSPERNVVESGGLRELNVGFPLRRCRCLQGRLGAGWQRCLQAQIVLLSLRVWGHQWRFHRDTVGFCQLRPILDTEAGHWHCWRRRLQNTLAFAKQSMACWGPPDNSSDRAQVLGQV